MLMNITRTSSPPSKWRGRTAFKYTHEWTHAKEIGQQGELKNSNSWSICFSLLESLILYSQFGTLFDSHNNPSKRYRTQKGLRALPQVIELVSINVRIWTGSSGLTVRALSHPASIFQTLAAVESPGRLVKTQTSSTWRVSDCRFGNGSWEFIFLTSS